MYLWKMTRKEYLILPSPFLCEIVIKKYIRLSILVTEFYLNSSSNLTEDLYSRQSNLFFSNKKIIVSFFNDPMIRT